MKTFKNHALHSLYLLFVFLLPVLSSCENIVLDEEGNIQQKDDCTSYKIKTRTSDGSALQYPLHIYAFTSDGQLQSRLSLSNESQASNISLPKGMVYKLVVLSADEGEYDLPSNPTLSSIITLSPKSTGVATVSPLLMGFADINATQANTATCNIALQYQVCSMQIDMQNVPSSISDIQVMVSSPYTGVTMGGTGVSNTNPSVIPLHAAQTNGATSNWSSGKVYLFPTVAPQTTFSISYSQGGETHFSSVTYQAVLRAGTPYILNGTFADDAFRLNANIVNPDWASPVYINFDFGDGVDTNVSAGNDTDTGGNSNTDTTAYPVDRIPAVYDSWNGHVVVGVLDQNGEPMDDSNAASATLLLISKSDWGGLTSALYAAEPSVAQDIADAYVEDGLSDWRIPTEQEAILLHKAYNVYATETSVQTLLESALSAAGADPIVLAEKGEKVRYLCEKAEKTYSYYVASILTAGTKVKTYHLRLVRSVKVTTS